MNYDLRPLSMWIYSKMLLKICMPISVKAYLSRRNLLVLSSHTDSIIFGRELLLTGYWSIKFVTKDLQNLLKVLECFCFDCVSESNASFSESNFIYFIWDSVKSLVPVTLFFSKTKFRSISKVGLSSMPEIWKKYKKQIFSKRMLTSVVVLLFFLSNWNRFSISSATFSGWCVKTSYRERILFPALLRSTENWSA